MIAACLTEGSGTGGGINQASFNQFLERLNNTTISPNKKKHYFSQKNQEMSKIDQTTMKWWNASLMLSLSNRCCCSEMVYERECVNV